MTEARILNETVIKNGFCIGCGACASRDNSAFSMKFDDFGNIVAFPSDSIDNNETSFLKICPFSGESLNEDELADIFFPHASNISVEIGKFESCYAGFVTEGDFRKRGSSGGIAKWIGYQLLEKGEIDYFVQLIPNQTDSATDPLFDFQFFSDKRSILNGSKSSYYPVTLEKVINRIRENPGRYAITGVPCFIKTLRLMASMEPVLAERIKYTLGIVCGGMKSANQAKMIGWELGVHPNNLIAIDFRRKYSDRPASQKIYQVWSNKDHEERYKNAGNIYGTDYGSGLFKPKACDYCDDVVGETADVSIGDAWLPRFRNDPQGTSLIIVRNSKINQILLNGKKKNKISIFGISAEEAAGSQSGGFRHRREGLSYRIAKKSAANEWFPEKRVKPNEFKISSKRKKIYSLRENIAVQSHNSFFNALKSGNLELFHRSMDPLLKEYNRLNDGGFLKKASSKAKRLITKIFSKFSKQ